MKKIIVNGVCASLVCFMLSSFSANSNNLAGNGYSPLQDTSTHKMTKKKMKMDKTTGDTTKMKMKKKPS